MDRVCLTIPAKPEYVPTLRLVTASVAHRCGFDVETIDDLRVCVSEAVNDRMQKDAELSVCMEITDTAYTFRLHGAGADKTDENREMRMMILRSLLDDVQETADGLVLTKHRTDC